jgi:hypothetical protein
MPALPNHPAYRIWIKDFIKALFDWSFTETVTVKMLPLLFCVGVVTAAVASIYLIANAFMSSLWEGLAYFLISPVFFIFAVAAIRSTLEFFSAVFNLQAQMALINSAMKDMNQDIGGMHNKIESMRDNAQLMVDSMNDFKGLTQRLPFMKKNTRPNKAKYWAESPLDAQFDFNDLGNSPDDKSNS